MNITTKIIITDTNIITDLYNANLLEKFINLDNVYISDMVKCDEINSKTGNVELINKFKVISATPLQLIEVNKLSITEKKLSTYDLLNYMLNDNRVEKDKFYIGTIDSNDDCKISGNFVEPGKKDKIKAKSIKSMTDSNILIVDEQYKVQVEGNVLYTSDNCKIDDDGIVTTAKSDDGLSYIVYDFEE